MEEHSGGTPVKAFKSEVLYRAAPRGCYSNPATYDDADLPGKRTMGVVDRFCYAVSRLDRCTELQRARHMARSD